MNILVYGLKQSFVKELKELCKKDNIIIYEKSDHPLDIQLLATDFPIEEVRKGIFSKIPFLVISKEQREEKILEAFGMGAEDYIIYPINPKIVKMRMLRILQHYGKNESHLQLLNERVHFTPNEYRILSYMMEHPGKLISRNELIEGAFWEHYEGYDRNIDNYMKDIRKKLKEIFPDTEKIQTVYGAGYRFEP